MVLKQMAWNRKTTFSSTVSHNSNATQNCQKHTFIWILTSGFYISRPTLVRLTVETRFSFKLQVVTLTGGNNWFSYLLPSAKRRIESTLKHGDDYEEVFRNRWKGTRRIHVPKRFSKSVCRLSELKLAVSGTKHDRFSRQVGRPTIAYWKHNHLRKGFKTR